MMRFLSLLPALALLVAPQRQLSAATTAPQSSSVISLDGQWSLAVDPKNVGRQEKWWEKPAAGGEIGQGPRDHPRGLSRLSRRRVALARRDAAGEPARRRPLPAAVLECRLSGRRLAQRRPPRPARRRRRPICARRDRGRQAAGGQSPGRARFSIRRTSRSTASVCRRPRTRRRRPPGSPAGAAIGAASPIPSSCSSFRRSASRTCSSGRIPSTGRIRVSANVRNAGEEVVRQRIVLSVAPAAGGETFERRAIRPRVAAGRLPDRKRVDGGASAALGAKRSVSVPR